LKGKPGFNIRILGYINRIIDNDKLMTENIPVNQNRCQGQNQADDEL
jgi:hypothetical protein